MKSKRCFVLAIVSLFAICVIAGCSSNVSVPDATRCANNWKKQGYDFDPNSMNCPQMFERVQAIRRAKYWREKGYDFDPNSMTTDVMDLKVKDIGRARYWREKSGYDFDPNSMTAREMDRQARELDKIEYWKRIGYHSDPNSGPLVETRHKPDAEVDEPNNLSPAAPVPVDEPNEVPPVAPPPVPSPALEVDLQRTAWDIGPEVYYFKYKEPGVMEDEGIFYGVRFGYTFRDWVPASPKESPLDGGTMFRAEGRYAYGKVTYDGSLSDGTPYTVHGIEDFVVEGRLLLGADMLRGDTLNTLYAGIGYRYLNDDTSFDPVGYERESNYLYVPLGFQFDSSDKRGWSWGFNAEVDFLIVGYQRSHLSDVSPALYDDVENRQESGYGYRASVRLQHKSEDAIFVIEPFFRYWDIDDSEVSYDRFGVGWIEPANETTEVGVQLFWMF